MYQQLHMLQENISFSFTVLTDEPISAECTIAASDKKNPNRTELPVVFRPFSRKKNVGANGCYNSLVAFLSVHHTDDWAWSFAWLSRILPWGLHPDVQNLSDGSRSVPDGHARNSARFPIVVEFTHSWWQCACLFAAKYPKQVFGSFWQNGVTVADTLNFSANSGISRYVSISFSLMVKNFWLENFVFSRKTPDYCHTHCITGSVHFYKKQEEAVGSDLVAVILQGWPMLIVILLGAGYSGIIIWLLVSTCSVSESFLTFCFFLLCSANTMKTTTATWLANFGRTAFGSAALNWRHILSSAVWLWVKNRLRCFSSVCISNSFSCHQKALQWEPCTSPQRITGNVQVMI